MNKLAWTDLRYNGQDEPQVSTNKPWQDPALGKEFMGEG